jgi:hypothetical protein
MIRGHCTRNEKKNRRQEAMKRRLMPVLIFTTQLIVVTIAGCGGDDKPLDTDRDRVADTVDCAAQDPQAWQLLTFASRDADADTYRVNTGGQQCVGSALLPGYFAAAVAAGDVDCDDSSAATWAIRPYVAVDSDADGFGVAGAGQICTGATLPAGLFAALPAARDIDCDDANAARWRSLPFASRDEDADGYRFNESGAHCGQETLPANLNAETTSALLEDCDDADAARWRRMAVFLDPDGDGTGSGAALRQCIGTTPPNGHSLTGFDPLDDPNDSLSSTITTLVLSSSALTVSDDGDDDDIF